MKLGKGDIVTITDRAKHLIKWKNDFKEISILEIIDKGNDWIVAIIDQPYYNSIGKELNEILLSNLEKDVMSSRRNIIDDLLD